MLVPDNRGSFIFFVKASLNILLIILKTSRQNIYFKVFYSIWSYHGVGNLYAIENTLTIIRYFLLLSPIVLEVCSIPTNASFH